MFATGAGTVVAWSHPDVEVGPDGLSVPADAVAIVTSDGAPP
jgi:hypothetical protein